MLSKNTALPEKKFSIFQLINLAIGIIGIQFAWSMQIALSSRVLEPLGASPFLYGLIWCAGPITGMLVQPLVGAWSDKTYTRFGRRRPFLLVGAVTGAIGLLCFPFSSSLLVAALLIWAMDACVNVSQGPYRALVPDIVPAAQHGIANSYINLAFGAGPIIALGTAPLLEAFGIQMSIGQQYVLAAAGLLFTMLYTCGTIREAVSTETALEQKAAGKKRAPSLKEIWSLFRNCHREVHKICAIQFVLWIGFMCMFIYLTPYVVHSIYGIPDMSTAPFKYTEAVSDTLKKADWQHSPREAVQKVSALKLKYSVDNAALARFSQEMDTRANANGLSVNPAEGLSQTLKVMDAGISPSVIRFFDFLKQREHQATKTAQVALVIFNIVCFILSVPLGYLSERYGQKNVFAATLLCLSLAYAIGFYATMPWQVFLMMGLAGVAWSTILSIPYSLLCKYIPKGHEGTLMGILNIFIASPQLLSAAVIGWIISQCAVTTPYGAAHNWSLAFGIASVCALIATLGVKFLLADGKEAPVGPSPQQEVLSAALAS